MKQERPMRILSLIAAIGVAIATHFQSYNGLIDGNTCTALTPPLTNTAAFRAPTNAVNTGNIGITQLVFQAVADHYVYTGSSIAINGITGTYHSQCCTATGCDAEAYATNSFSECGLTWCGGVENQWQYIDFIGTSIATTGVPQNSTVTVSFTGGVPVALAGGDSGDPVVAISYQFVALPSQTTTPSSSLTPSSSQTSSASVSVSPTPSLTPSVSNTPSSSLSPSASSTLTPSSSPTLSLTPSSSPTPSKSSSASQTWSITSSETGSSTYTPSSTSSETGSTGSSTSSPSITSIQTRSQTPPSTPTRNPTTSPAGICYSVSTQNGLVTSLSSGWIIVVSGINVTQAYGSGYISMGTFAGCTTIGSTCKCSYTQGSTVAGCGSRRNSYITYSYGSTTGITYTNESPTCSYNFAGTIGIPPSGSPSPSLTTSRSRAISNSRSQALSASQSLTESKSNTITYSPTQSQSITNSPSSNGICQAAFTTLNGVRETVPGDVTYYITHFANMTHSMGINVPEMPIGSFSGCSESATNCTCAYGPGSTANGCISARFGYITYEYGSVATTIFRQQEPTCYYYFSGILDSPSSATPTSSITATSTVSSTESRSLSGLPSQSLTASRTMAATLKASFQKSISSTVTVTKSSSATESTTPSLSSTQTLSSTPSSSLSSSVYPSLSVSASITKSYTTSPSIHASSTESSSSSQSIRASATESSSSSMSVSSSASLSASGSESPSTSITESGSPSMSITVRQTPSHSGTATRTIQASKSYTQTISSYRTASVSLTASSSTSITETPSPSISATETSTPLVYCIPYPSSTSSATETPSNTPLFLMTPWPTNGSASPSTSPFFMMIPYPSVSPNQTIVDIPAIPDTVGTAVGGAAIGAISTSILLVGYQYFMPKRKPTQTRDEQPQVIVLELDDEGLIPVYVNPSDLEEIKRLLLLHRKPFAIRSKP